MTPVTSLWIFAECLFSDIPPVPEDFRRWSLRWAFGATAIAKLIAGRAIGRRGGAADSGRSGPRFTPRYSASRARLKPVRAALSPSVAPPSRAKQELLIPTLAPPLPTFIAAAHGRRISAPSVLKRLAGVRDDPVPATCWDRGRALSAQSLFAATIAPRTIVRRWASGALSPSPQPASHANGNNRRRLRVSERFRFCLWPTARHCATGIRRSCSRAFEKESKRHSLSRGFEAQLRLLHRRWHAHSTPAALPEPRGAGRRRVA